MLSPRFYDGSIRSAGQLFSDEPTEHNKAEFCLRRSVTEAVKRAWSDSTARAEASSQL